MQPFTISNNNEPANNGSNQNINLDDLSIGQARQLASLLGNLTFTAEASQNKGLNAMIGQKVIVRTYSAGIHFGVLAQKAGDEVILSNARCLWLWRAAEGICTHGVARGGLVEEKSRISAPVESLWLQAIEIVPCTAMAAASIEGAEHAHP